MNTRPKLPAAAVLIPDWWTPEQALAVFELLNDLRDTLWAIHGRQIQDLLQHQKGSIISDLQHSEPKSDDQSF
jgi:hypothetical protein